MSGERFGRLGAAVQVTFAAIIGIPSWLAANDSPEFLPRGVVLFFVYALPGAVAWIGATRGSRALVGAAALGDIPGSILAFSGVTLVFLIPAILLGAAALRMPPRTISACRAALGAGVAALEAAFMIGAGLAMLFITRPLCWITTQTQAGRTVRIVPTIEGTELFADQGGGCTSAAITLEGVAIGLLLGLIALAIALWWSPRTAGGAPG